jgi:membrane associated rhomboid family serine protease
MRLAILGESPSDEIALRILAESILGFPTLEAQSAKVRSRGWPAILNVIPAVIKHLHHQQAADNLIIVADSDDTRLHEPDHDANPVDQCRLCQLRKVSSDVVPRNSKLLSVPNSRRLQPLVLTYLLIGINVLVSLIGFSRMSGETAAHKFLFVPSEVAEGRNYVGMFLSHFSHADGAHLLFNMITLYSFGPVVEEGLGPVNMLLIYAVAGVVSTVFVYYLHRANPRYRALGASDSVTGIIFAAIVILPSMEVLFFFLPIPIPAPVFAVAYIALSTYLMKRGGGNISHEAHLAGAASGLLLAGLLDERGFGPLLRRLQSILS